MKKFFKSAWAWLKLSNRWKHLLGGFLIGLGSCNFYCAVYAGGGVGAAMELKDRLWGGKFDLIDFSMALLGSILGFALTLLI